jgi:hypothetical protein
MRQPADSGNGTQRPANTTARVPVSQFEHRKVGEGAHDALRISSPEGLPCGGYMMGSGTFGGFMLGSGN